MPGSPPRLAPQARPHALADLQPLIAKAEQNRDRCRRALELINPRSMDGPANVRRARAYLHIAETRLAELCRSREVLIGGENQSGPEEEAEAS
jgi:hypothetical protein